MAFEKTKMVRRFGYRVAMRPVRSRPKRMRGERGLGQRGGALGPRVVRRRSMPAMYKRALRAVLSSNRRPRRRRR